MRLHSSHKDYYDVMQRTDLEPMPRFVRKNTTEHVLYKDKARVSALAPLSDVLGSIPVMRDIGLHASVLGFCGKLIPLYRILEVDIAGCSSYRSFTSVHEVTAYLRAVPVPWESNGRLDHQRMIRALDEEDEHGADQFHGLSFNVKGWERWMQTKGRSLDGNHDDLFRLVGSPVFLLRGLSYRCDRLFSSQEAGVVLECNPVLKGLGWHRHMEPFEVWQTIDQYLGNQMAEQEDPAPLSDELRRDAHGFDDRSFKTSAPGKRKARRKANKARKRGETP